MCGPVIDPMGGVGVREGILPGDGVWDRDLAHLSAFGDVELRFLIICLDGLDPAGIGIALPIDFVPDAVIRVSRLAVLIDGADLKDLVGPEIIGLVGVETRTIVQGDATPGDASLLRRLGCQGAGDTQVF